MMTPQEVANCTFTKAALGGYHMASVDDFLDKLTEDYTALYKENAALKAKMKVLAEKVEEYREVEDAMRATLLTAQKMATSMVSEAEQKRDALIADAAVGAKRRLEEIQVEVAAEEHRLQEVRRQVDEQLAAEERRLAAGQEELRGFIRSVQSVCQEQLALLERLPELPAQPQIPVVTAPAAEPVRIVEEESPQQPAAEEESPALDSAAALEKDIQDALASLANADQIPAEEAMDDPFAMADDEEDETATRVLKLDELQFGRNYNRE